MSETALIQSQHLSISQTVFRSVAMSETAYMQKTSEIQTISQQVFGSVATSETAYTKNISTPLIQSSQVLPCLKRNIHLSTLAHLSILASLQKSCSVTENIHASLSRSSKGLKRLKHTGNIPAHFSWLSEVLACHIR